MPLLSDQNVQHLLQMARGSGVFCRDCGQRMVTDYCRSCDEMYWLHGAGCVRGDQKEHYGHRLTIVPFVEVK
jgi:hypothetical protein